MPKPSMHPAEISELVPSEAAPVKLPTYLDGCGISNVTHRRIVGGKPAKIGIRQMI